MKVVTRKLKSRAGISLAIALVFFLLCAMVGTVVLSAASASAGNTARERQLYRETQALISAAQLLSQDIQAITYTGSYTKTETVTTTVTPAAQEGGDPSTQVTTEEKYDLLDPELKDSKLFEAKDGSDNLNLTARYKEKLPNEINGSLSTMPNPQTLKFGSILTSHIPEVTGSIAVEANYDLTVELVCGKNSMTLMFPAKATSHTEIKDPVTTEISAMTSQKVTEKTYSTILTWGQPLMQEGGKDHGETA